MHLFQFNRSWRLLAPSLISCGIFFSSALQAADATVPATQTAPKPPPPVESFFQYPSFTSAALSPNGRFLGVLIAPKNERVKLAVLDLETQQPKLIGGFSDADVKSFHWLNDNRLVYDLGDRETAAGDTRHAAGLFAVNRDGSGYQPLVNRKWAMVQERRMRELLPWHTRFFATSQKQDSDEVFVTQFTFKNTGDIDAVNLLRVNTVSGRAVTIQRPGHSMDWLLDQNGVPSITTTIEKDMESVYYKDPAKDEWRKLAEFNIHTGDGIKPYYFGPDGTFFVLAHNGKDKVAIHTYDLAANKINPESVISMADYDFSGEFVANQSKTLGVHYVSDAPATLWFDEGMKKIQKSVDDSLPGTINRLSIGRRSETPYVLVSAFSDIQAGMFFYITPKPKNSVCWGVRCPILTRSKCPTRTWCATRRATVLKSRHT